MKIKMKLSVSSVNSAINKVKQYQKQLSAKTDEVSKELAQSGAEKASLKVRQKATYGNLNDIASSIEARKKSDGHWIVVTDNFKAPYVEFGTGVRGKNSPHPESAEMGWAYMTGHFTYHNGQLGWWYPTTADDPNTTLRQTETGDWIAFTAGMPSRPFMHETALELRNEAKDTVKKVFKSD